MHELPLCGHHISVLLCSAGVVGILYILKNTIGKPLAQIFQSILGDYQDVGIIIYVWVGIYSPVAQQLVELLLGSLCVGCHIQFVCVERIHAGRVVHLSAQEMLKGNVQMLLDGEWGAILFPFPSLYLVPVCLREYPGVIAIEGKCLQIVGLVLWRSMAQEDIVHVATYPCGRLVIRSMLTQFALHGGIALSERTEHAHHATFQWGMAVLMVFCEESPLGYICHAV